MIIQHFKMAIHSLKSNKVRTFLTLLGIIIGVMSVTTIIGLGEGVKRQVNQQINELGNDLITVVPGRNTSISGFDSLLGNLGGIGGTTARLSEDDLSSLRSIEGVEKVSGIMQLDGSIDRAGKKQNTRILAVDENYLDLTQQKLTSGQFFGGRLENNETVILASDIAESLFGSEDPIGSAVKIRGVNFIIIGILSEKDGFNLGQPINDMALIPLPTGKRLNHNNVHLQQITLQVSRVQDAARIADIASDILLKNHDDEEDFTVTTQNQLIEATESVFKILTGFTAAVASISLLVGGIGVMNIMLVTVTERTKEIGVRKAVGATRTQIMMQFLVEALVITISGGVIGILISVIAGYVIKSQTAISPALDPWIILLAAGVSVAVGVVFGTWPAIRAARKSPTQALRYD